MIIVRHTTINRTHSSTLWLFMEPHALCTFVCYYKIYFIAYWFLCLIGIHAFTIWKDNIPLKVSSIGITPIIGSFINGIVWALRLTSTTIYAFICYYNCHSLYFF